MANFKVVNIFLLEARNIIVFTGYIVSGKLDSGMSIINERFNIKIKSIEMVNLPDNNGLVGLTVDYDNDISLNQFKSLKNTIVFIS